MKNSIQHITLSTSPLNSVSLELAFVRDLGKEDIVEQTIDSFFYLLIYHTDLTSFD